MAQNDSVSDLEIVKHHAWTIVLWALVLACAVNVHSHEAVNSTDPSTATELARVLACNDRAVGGPALRRVNRVRYELQIEEPGFTAVGHYAAERLGRAQIDVFVAEQRVFSEGWDGHAGWQLPQGATKPVATSPDGAAALRHGIEQPGHLWTLADMPQNGHAVEFVGRDSIQGTNYYVVKLTLRDHFESWYWLNPLSCLIERNRNFRAFHPDLDPKRRWTETLFDDYRVDQGVMRSYLSRTVDMATGAVIGTTRILKLTNDTDALRDSTVH
jgi:hypothetical protein